MAKQSRFVIISDGRGMFVVIDTKDKNNELFAQRFAEYEHAEYALERFLAEPEYPREE
jgi:hypothetical protein